MLIGLSGYAGAGKDEVAKVLVREHGFTRVAFADPLREMLYALNPTVVVGDVTAHRLQALVDEFGWDVAKRNFPEIRALLQRLGTEAGRAVLGPNCWVDLAMSKVTRNTVITDCRFPNEAHAVRAAGGQLWRVVRPGVAAVNGHISESGFADNRIARTILNDGTLSDLGYAVFGAVTGRGLADYAERVGI